MKDVFDKLGNSGESQLKCIFSLRYFICISMGLLFRPKGPRWGVSQNTMAAYRAKIETSNV